MPNNVHFADLPIRDDDEEREASSEGEVSKDATVTEERKETNVTGTKSADMDRGLEELEEKFKLKGIKKQTTTIRPTSPRQESSDGSEGEFSRPSSPNAGTLRDSLVAGAGAGHGLPSLEQDRATDPQGKADEYDRDILSDVKASGSSSKTSEAESSDGPESSDDA